MSLVRTAKTILNEIYHAKNILGSNAEFTGLKNEYQPFEELVERVIQNYALLANDSTEANPNCIYYTRNPNGCQKPPDFIIGQGQMYLKIECKSSKTLKPMWNCSLPEMDTVYVFQAKTLNTVFVCQGSDLISESEKCALSDLHASINKMVQEFNQNQAFGFTYYPRKMFNQVHKFELKQRQSLYDSTLRNIQSLLH